MTSMANAMEVTPLGGYHHHSIMKALIITNEQQQPLISNNTKYIVTYNDTLHVVNCFVNNYYLWFME